MLILVSVLWGCDGDEACGRVGPAVSLGRSVPVREFALEEPAVAGFTDHRTALGDQFPPHERLCRASRHLASLVDAEVGVADVVRRGDRVRLRGVEEDDVGVGPRVECPLAWHPERACGLATQGTRLFTASS